MSAQPETAIRRRPDGSIDTDFYIGRAGRLRSSARNEFLSLCIGHLRAAFARTSQQTIQEQE